MKKIIVLATASLALVGCNKQDNGVKESAKTEKDQIEQSKDAQKEALNQEKKNIEQASDQAKSQINAQAKAEKKQIEELSDAQKAQINEEKKRVEAQADAAKAGVNSQVKIDEAAGTANTKSTGLTAQDQGKSDADRQITRDIRRTIVNSLGTDNSIAAKNITIITRDGKVTLKGAVRSETEKQNLETQAKAVSGVTSVDNRLEVK